MKCITRVLLCLLIGVTGKYDVQSKPRNECFDYNIGYPFNDVDTSLALFGDSSTKSEFACQKSCQELLKCQFWTWHNNNHPPFPLLLVAHSRFSVGSPGSPK